jgi:hypothetical protein
MTRAWWGLAALLAAVVALGWIAYLKPPAAQPPVHPLSSLKPAEASRVRIEPAGRPAIALEKKDGQWFLTAPLAARAEPLQVQRALAILEARAPARLPARDLARFELDAPRLTLTVDGQVFRFGALSPLTREQYVLTGDAVYVVEPRYGAALPVDPVPFIRRTLFAAGEVPVALDLGAFTVTRRDGAWTLAPPAPGLGADDIPRWVDEWRLAAALRAEPHDGREPRHEIRVQLDNGRALALGVLQHEPELVLLRRDEGLQYHFFADTGRRLLAPPGGVQRK